VTSADAVLGTYTVAEHAFDKAQVNGLAEYWHPTRCNTAI
jgi:hypothetical protein